MLRVITCLAFALATAGCVRANTAMLDDRTAVISARGTAFDNTANVLKRVVVEAATAARSRGYTHFQIVGAKDTTRVDPWVRPERTRWSGRLDCIGPGCTIHGTGTTTPASSIPFVKPGADVMVRFYQAEEVTPDMQGVFNVASVLAADQ